MMNIETDLSSIRLCLAGTCATILTRVTIASSRHITTFTIIICNSVLLAALTGLTITCSSIKAGDIASTGSDITKFASSIFRTIAFFFVGTSFSIDYTSSAITINTIAQIDFTSFSTEWFLEYASATEFLSTPIVKACSSILFLRMKLN